MHGALTLAAVTIATALATAPPATAALPPATAALPPATAALPPATAAHAGVSRAAGNGDRNGNSATVRLGNGIRNVSQLTVGSARSGTGIQQRTVGVGGLANAQSIVCRRSSRLCDLTQRVRASDRQNDVVRLPEARTRRDTGSPSSRRTSTASPRRAP